MTPHFLQRQKFPHEELSEAARAPLEAKIKDWVARRRGGDVKAPHPLTEEEQASLNNYLYAVGATIEDGDVTVRRWVPQAEAIVTPDAWIMDVEDAKKLAECLGCGITTFVAIPPVIPTPSPEEDEDTARRRRVAKHLPREERVARGFGTDQDLEAIERERTESTPSPPKDSETEGTLAAIRAEVAEVAATEEAEAEARAEALARRDAIAFAKTNRGKSAAEQARLDDVAAAVDEARGAPSFLGGA